MPNVKVEHHLIREVAGRSSEGGAATAGSAVDADVGG
jgi:hypothetical protein